MPLLLCHSLLACLLVIVSITLACSQSLQEYFFNTLSTLGGVSGLWRILPVSLT